MDRSSAHVVTKQAQVSSYERLVRRINAHIAEPRAQLARRCVVSRLDTDCEDDWEKVLDEMREVDGLSVKRTGNSYEFAWREIPASD